MLRKFTTGVFGLASRSAMGHTKLAAVYARPMSSESKRGYVEWSTSSSNLSTWTEHEQLRTWILDRIRLLQPSRVHLCDGSDQENQEMLTNMVHAGTLIPLNPKLRPNSYLARSSTSDVARVEEKTFICSEHKNDAGFTNNWRDPEEMQRTMTKLFEGAMRGRTMYVIPVSRNISQRQQEYLLAARYLRADLFSHVGRCVSSPWVQSIPHSLRSEFRSLIRRTLRLTCAS